MKSVFIFLFMSVWAHSAQGAACCEGGGPKNFLGLARLQSYKVGLSTSIREVYGRFDPYGDLVTSDKNHNYNLSLGAAARLIHELEGSLILPLSHQIKALGKNESSTTNISDILIGIKYPLLQSFFQDEWYPTISALAGMKFPTGSVDTFQAGEFEPGTGNGNWEPYIGVGLSKEYGFGILTINAVFTKRFLKAVNDTNGTVISIREGDKIELSEAATFPVSRKLSFTIGSSQAWELNRTVDSKTIPDSSTRVLNGFLSSIYFLTQYWSLAATFDASLPVVKLGVNQQATRTIALTTTYGFY